MILVSAFRAISICGLILKAIKIQILFQCHYCMPVVDLDKFSTTSSKAVVIGDTF